MEEQQLLTDDDLKATCPERFFTPSFLWTLDHQHHILLKVYADVWSRDGLECSSECSHHQHEYSLSPCLPYYSERISQRITQEMWASQSRTETRYSSRFDFRLAYLLLVSLQSQRYVKGPKRMRDHLHYHKKNTLPSTLFDDIHSECVTNRHRRTIKFGIPYSYLDSTEWRSWRFTPAPSSSWCSVDPPSATLPDPSLALSQMIFPDFPVLYSFGPVSGSAAVLSIMSEIPWVWHMKWYIRLSVNTIRPL